MIEKANLSMGLSGMSLDDFGIKEEIKNKITDAAIVELSLSVLEDYKEHHFKSYSEDKLKEMAESIKLQGVIQPIIVWKNGGYTILSGHNRVRAARLAGLDSIKSIVLENLTDDQAKLIVTETNLHQRSFSDLSISERVKSLRQRFDALGERLSESDELEDLDYLKKVEKSGEGLRVSATTLFRYIKMSDLNDELLDLVDSGRINFVAGYDLSFLTQESQSAVAVAMKTYSKKIDIEKSRQLRLLEQEEGLNQEKVLSILLQVKEKKSKSKYVLKDDFLKRFKLFGLRDDEITKIITDALTVYFDNK